MRKEIEIVKKSLEELKEKEATPPLVVPAVVDLSKNLSSASDLLALVHASIQSRTQSVPSSINTLTSNVVATSTQPRSFGDLPSTEMLVKPSPSTQFLAQAPVAATITPVPMVRDEPMHQSPMDNFNEPFNRQDEPMQASKNNFIDQPYNQVDNNYNQTESYNQTDNYKQEQSYDQGDSYNQNDNYNPPQSFNQNDPYQGDSYNQDNSYNEDGSYKPNEPYNQNENYNQNKSFAQNQPYNQNQNQSYNQNQNQPYVQPWNNPLRHNIPDNRGPMNQGFNQGGQGGPLMPTPVQNHFQPRGNFMNGRQDNMNQNKFGNFSGNTFRGRGRGNFNGGPRGRGRGRF